MSHESTLNSKGFVVCMLFWILDALSEHHGDPRP
jgi:hypothetical protein